MDSKHAKRKREEKKNQQGKNIALRTYIKFEFKNKTEQNRNDKKYSQSGITIIIHTNHDGVRATAIMLSFFRALAASCVLYNRTEHSQGFSIC